MPYISQEERDILDTHIDETVNQIHLILIKQRLKDGKEETDYRDVDGKLNYCITELLVKTMKLDSDPRYTKINTVLGILSGIALEFYRRLGGPYESTAITKNGDIGTYKRFVKWFKDKSRVSRFPQR